MPIYNLPIQIAPFVGRTHELDQIAKLMADPACRLLTLVGPGGIGKTRLALEAVRLQPDVFSDGVYFILLQSLSSSDFMFTAIADALDFKFYPGGESKEQHLKFLQAKNLLLVMDNLEHLLDGVVLLSNILSIAPNIKILATSREPLNLLEEWVFEVGGLRFPASESEIEIESYDAVQLFIQNAQRASSNFRLCETDKPDVIRICQIVDGMPLALELAAIWIRALSYKEIAEELEHGLDILETHARNIPERHRNMRSVLDHSWRLLTDAEQEIFRKLSVFRGGFTRAAAEAVSNTSLPILAALVDKSLLRHTSHGRYDIHELLHQYGDEQLIRSSTKDMTQDAHSVYYLEFLHQLEQDIKGRRQVAALNEVEADFENIRIAWQWGLRRKNYHALDLASESLFYFCEMRGRCLEGNELFQTTQEQLAPEPEPKQQCVRGRILVRSLWLLILGGNGLEVVEKIRVQIEEVLVIARQHKDQSQIAFCLWFLGTVGHLTKDYARVIPFLEESLALFTDLGDPFYMARAADWLGAVYGSTGQIEKMIRFSEQSLNWRRAIGDRFGMAASLTNLAHAALWSGQYDQSKRYSQEMGQIYVEVGSGIWIVRQVAFLSRIAFQQGDFQETQARAEEALEISTKYGELPVEGLESTLVILGMLATLKEDYARCWELCLQAKSDAGPPNTAAEEGLAVAACGLENYSTAREYLLVALKLVCAYHDQRGMTTILPVAAIVLAHVGRKERATELLGLALNHPASARVWMEKWPLLTRLRAQLEAELGSEEYSEAWERGKHSDIEEVAGSLLRYFQPDQAQQLPRAYKSELVEQLTERELEVLRQIAAGLTNAEIAEQLVVEVSTVKKHINRLYDKIGAKTRTHALVRAKELHLL